MVDYEDLQSRIISGIDNGVIPTLMEYIRVPSLSPLFDPNWETNGLMEQAQNILLSYVNSLQIKGYSQEILKEPGKPWMYFGEIQATNPGLGTIFIYGHMDKQPHFPNWIEGTNNSDPAIIDEKLYGRGGADDGYAIPSAALLIKTLQDSGIPHGRIVIIGESEEESGSPNLKYYIEKLKKKIGNPDLIICLDSGAGDYEHLWLTSTLRGLVSGDLTVKVLKNGMHSGAASGIVPSSFRIIRQLIERIEDSYTGKVLIQEMYQDITDLDYAKAESVAKVLGWSVFDTIEWNKFTSPVTTDITQAIINKTLKPTLSVIGADGFPSCSLAGNVLRPFTTLSLSIRLPPSVNATLAANKLFEILTSDPPYNATVEFNNMDAGNGFKAPELDQWMEDALNKASNKYFGFDFLYMGEGGSIPFMGMLNKMFPTAKFVVTGVCGPSSNTHSANEFLHIPYLKKLLPCLAALIAAHANH